MKAMTLLAVGLFTVVYKNVKMDYFYRLFYTALVSLIFFSCGKNEDLAILDNKIQQYYPLELGQQRYYAVDSITYDFDGNTSSIRIDTHQYFQKELVNTVIQFTNAIWYVVEISTSESLDGDYLDHSIVLERIEDNQRLLVKKGNLTFIPLVSYISLYDEWDGTAMFNKSAVEIFIEGEKIKPYENWNYQFIEILETVKIDQNTYNNVWRINQIDTSSINTTDNGGNPIQVKPEQQLFYNLANEWYAPGRGLIKKEEIQLISICASSSVNEYIDFCDTTTIFENAEQGYIYRKKLLKFE
ncbi:hypothetical protein [Membranihabitans marinus]|uniref:hypothetical protein n=1 Tax=Membranihabitans marinus TaxID=1227546 RepID=UPI001F201EFE|nr:hypothetical protein [Membranihabitans marinus]